MTKSYFDYKDNFSPNQNVKSVLILGKPTREKRKITIAIPTYKRPELLEVSLKSAINQFGFDDYEVIIVDNDPESKETGEVVKKYLKDNVYYFKNTANIGLYSNWNRCIELAKGRFITILNDDDWLSPNYLQRCQKYLKKNVDGLYFKYNTVYEKSFAENGVVKNRRFEKVKAKLAKMSKKLTLFDFLLGNKSAGTLGVIFKTNYLKILGGYNPDYFPSSDYILHTKYCSIHNVYRINEVINYYRIAENESANQETLRKWEYLDTDIRSQIISRIGKHKKFLQYLNKLVTEMQIKGLIDTWNYQTKTEIKHNLRHTLFEKISGLKYDLNI